MLDAFHHEIYDRLWCVDDAVCVCDFDGEALKKLLVDGVEESLFLREVRDRRSGFLDCGVERFQETQKFRAIQRSLGEHINDGLNFTGDNIASRKVGIIEDGAEDTFR